MLPLLIKPETYSDHFDLRRECHLWFLDLTQLPEDTVRQTQLFLSTDELQRMRTLKRRQLEFIATRALVRLCLSRYTNEPPQSLQLKTAEKGKPFLAGANTPIQFNLSHCNQVAVLVIGWQAALGVDIESTTRNRSQREIAARYFHPLELAQLEKLDNPAHNTHFFRLWTLKEAFFKATGEGISAGLEKAAFHLEGQTINAQLADELNTQADDWQFYQTFMNQDFCVALARHSGEEINIRWFDAAELFLQP
ncbi:MAG TPA: 4'-phosphopantetheinyl transferase superfamily protein [Cellvibrio sp.]|nr:4'-phosphopantetheinyl transferase superfamily protein [Cellvibrio sp.]